jgi:hypothetical protein
MTPLHFDYDIYGFPLGEIPSPVLSHALDDLLCRG